MNVLARLFLLLAVLFGALVPSVEGGDAEVGQVRVIVVVDTDDAMGETWKLDGDNVRAVLEAGFRKQGLSDRVAFEVFQGKRVNAQTVLQYIESLPVDPNVSLVFYYSGHGGYHLGKGHFLALKQGPLFRKPLIDAMQSRTPKMLAVLTDCCANYAGGAWQGEPGAVSTQPLALLKALNLQKPERSEPPGASERELKRKSLRLPNVPRPDLATLAKIRKPTHEEPPSQVGPIKGDGKRQRIALVGEPIGEVFEGLVMITGNGLLRFDDLLKKTDGALLRDLFLKAEGVVDINGCEKGKLSHGTLGWGGSLFTIAFLSLQQEPVKNFDANGNQRIEWTEIFPALRSATQGAASRTGAGKLRQIPEANQLPK